MSRRPGDQPYFHISIVAEMLGLHPQTIRNYERMGLIQPSRTDGNMRLFSLTDMERVKRIQSYTCAGVNLAGVEIIMKLLDKIQELQEQMGQEMEQQRMDMLDELRRMHEKMNLSSNGEEIIDSEGEYHDEDSDVEGEFRGKDSNTGK